MNSVPTSHAVMLGIGIGLLLAFMTMPACTRPNVMEPAPDVITLPMAAPVREKQDEPPTVIGPLQRGQVLRVFPR